MKILMLDNEFPPLGGGMGTANQAVLRQFAKKPDLHVDLVTSALGGRSEFERFSERIRIYKVPVWNQNIHHSSNRELLLFTVQALVKAYYLHRRNSYDFSFAWSSVPSGAVALALNDLLSLPYYVWVSGPDIPGFEKRYQRLYPLITPLLRRIWKKARRVIDQVRGRHVVEALEMLHFMPHAAAAHVEKVVRSAVANAEENAGLSRENLYIASITADEGTGVMPGKGSRAGMRRADARRRRRSPGPTAPPCAGRWAAARA